MSGSISGFFHRLGIGVSGKKKLRLSDRQFAAATHPLRPTLDARYAALRTAMASGYRDPIAALLAPGFVSVDVRGKESTGDEMIDLVLGLDIDRSKRSATTTLVTVEEGVGVARVLQHYAMTTTADVGAGMPKSLQTLSADTWILSGGEWLLAKTRTLEIESVSGIGAHQYLEAKPSVAPPARFPLFVTARIWEYRADRARQTL